MMNVMGVHSPTRPALGTVRKDRDGGKGVGMGEAEGCSAALCRVEHLVGRSAVQCRAWMSFGHNLVAVYRDGGGVIGDADRQVRGGLAERVKRQHRHLAAGHDLVGLG
jgi:hypothetical protein